MVDADSQYGVGDVLAPIESALRAEGRNPGNLSLGDLAPLEEFHIGGRHASVELAEMALRAGERGAGRGRGARWPGAPVGIPLRVQGDRGIRCRTSSRTAFG